MTPEEREMLKQRLTAENSAVGAEMQSVQSQQDVAGYGSGIDKIIASIGRTKANPQVYNQMRKSAESSKVQDYLTKKYKREQDVKELELKRQGIASRGELAKATQESTVAFQKASLAQKDRDFEFKRDKPSPGEIVTQKKHAEEKADWEKTGKHSVENGIKNVGLVIKSLKGKKDSSIRKLRARTGSEGAMSEFDLGVKQKILTTTLPMMRAIFGARPSNDELKAKIESLYDAKLSPASNAKNLEAQVLDWKEVAAEKNSKFGLSSGKSAAPGMVTIRNDETGETKQVTQEEAKAMGAQ